MKSARFIYSVMLKLYPHGFRKAFGEQMMQTFSDNYLDIVESGGRVSLNFWLSTMTDEIKNILGQHVNCLAEREDFLRLTAAKSAVSAVFLLPLYAVFLAVLVKVFLALPHPPVSGLGVVITLAVLLLLPGILSVVTGYVLASVFLSICPKRRARVA